MATHHTALLKLSSPAAPRAACTPSDSEVEMWSGEGFMENAGLGDLGRDERVFQTATCGGGVVEKQGGEGGGSEGKVGREGIQGQSGEGEAREERGGVTRRAASSGVLPNLEPPLEAARRFGAGPGWAFGPDGGSGGLGLDKRAWEGEQSGERGGREGKGGVVGEDRARCREVDGVRGVRGEGGGAEIEVGVGAAFGSGAGDGADGGGEVGAIAQLKTAASNGLLGEAATLTGAHVEAEADEVGAAGASGDPVAASGYDWAALKHSIALI
ncbi:unnamed protein product [Closterium sp. Naga37s-1]|nr:unnamed protein product [Closterium sp. Naga37s-1]